MSTQRKSVASKRFPPDLSELVGRARHVLRDQRCIKVTALGPKELQPAVIEKLLADGYEATKSMMRVPLVRQLEEALAQGRFIPLKSVHTFVAGATRPEAKKAALDLVQRGGAHLVLRTKAETLVPRDANLVGRDELCATRDALASIVVRLKPLTNTTAKATLLRGDLDALLTEIPCAKLPRANSSPHAESPRQKIASTPASTEELVQQLLHAVDSTRKDGTGMSFVPDVVHALAPSMDVDTARSLLLEANRRALLELRPESGLRRLTEQELGDCLPGPQGTHLSWVRRL